MASRTDINISGHYIVSMNTMPFHTCTLSYKKLKGRTEFYIVFKTQRPLDIVF